MRKIKGGYKKAGELLTGILGLDRLEKGNSELNQELITLSGGRRDAVRTYYEQKAAFFLQVLTAGVAVAAVVGILSLLDAENTAVEELTRPGYGEGDRTEWLQVKLEGEEEAKELEVRVRERSYTQQEKQKLLDTALAELEELLPGENSSLDEVRTDLNMPAQLTSGAVSVSWVTVPYGVVDSQGRLTGAQEEDGTLVELKGTLTCFGQEAVYTAYARIFPPLQDEETQIQSAILKEVEKADLQKPYEASVVLPEEMDGRRLFWSREHSNPFFSILFLTLAAAAGLYIQKDHEVHKKAEKRREQLLLDYPDLMWKMTMLLGAGMSIRGAFMRISEEYLREKKRKKSKKIPIRYVYEEVTYACMEMQSGISEAQAYERFGKRCQLPEYIRLGTVLSQNLKKGAKGLSGMLEMEADASLTDRKNQAKQIGEKAGTRLLLPMVLMLGVVLAILMIPAFLSF